MAAQNTESQVSPKFYEDCREAFQLKRDGMTEDAAKSFRKILKRFVRANQVTCPEVAILNAELAKLNLISADYELSLSQMKTALELAEQLQMHSITRVASLHIGRCYFHLGRTEDAAKNFLSQLEVARKTEDRVQEAVVYDALVEAYTHKNHYDCDAATKYARCCDDVITRLPDGTTEHAQVLMTSGQVRLRVARASRESEASVKQGQLHGALEKLSLVDGSFISKAERVQLNLYKAEVLMDLEKLDEALQLGLEARDLAGDKHELLGDAWFTLAKVYRHLDDLGSQKRALDAALESFTVLDHKMKLYDINLALAQNGLHSLEYFQAFNDDLKIKKNESEKIANYLSEAMGVLYLVQSNLQEDLHRLSFSDRLTESVQLLQLVLFCTRGRVLDAMMSAEQDRASSLISCIWSQKVRGDVAEEKEKNRALLFLDHSLSEKAMYRVLRHLCDTALVYTFIKNQLFEGFLVWVVNAKAGPFGMESKIIPYPWDEFVTLISRLQGNIASKSRAVGVESRDAGHDHDRNALPELDDDFSSYSKNAAGRDNLKSVLRELHEILIQPFEESSEALRTHVSGRRLLIIPNSELFMIPFSALIGQSELYLFQNAHVMLAPSIRLLAYLNDVQETEPEDVKETPEFLVVGNPATPPESGLVRLPGAEREANNVAALFPGVHLLTGEAARKDVVLSKMATADFIHFACHGSWKESFLALAPARDCTGNAGDYRLTDADIIRMKLTASLVVLSACNSARGAISGEGVVGLARAFLAAGAQAVLVALWQLPDDATELVMTHFYSSFLKGHSASASLTAAMALSQGKLTDPFYWGAFCLIGANVFYNDAAKQNEKSRTGRTEIGFRSQKQPYNPFRL